MGARCFGAAAVVGLLAAMALPPAASATTQTTSAGTKAPALADWPGYGRFVSTIAVGARQAGAYTVAVDGDREVGSGPGSPPLEVDLRSFTMVPSSDGYIASLQFLGPVTHLTNLNGEPFTHEVSLTLTPPSGAPVTLSSTGDAQVAFLGNQVLIAVPASIGVAPDWTAVPTVSLRNAEQKGWKSTTPAVRVGALTGESPSGLQLVRSGSELDAVMHLDASPSTAGDLTLTVFSPDDRGGAAPLSLVWKQSAPTAAFVSTTSSRGVASVPVRVSGNDVTFVLSDLKTTTPTTAPASAGNTLDGTYQVDVDATIECQCPDSQQPASATEAATWNFQIEGQNIAVTDRATAKTAIGRVDQTSGEFTASNASELYGGHVHGGGGEFSAELTKVELPPPPGSGTGAGVQPRTEPIAFADPFSDFVKQAGDVLRKIMDRLFPKPAPPTNPPSTPPPVPKVEKAGVKDGRRAEPPLVIKFQDPVPLTEIGPPGDILTTPPVGPPPPPLDPPPVDPPWPVITPPQTQPVDDTQPPDWPFDDLTQPKRKRWVACAQTATQVMPCAAAELLLAAPIDSRATVPSGGSDGTSAVPFAIGGVAAGAALGFVLYRRRANARGTS